MSSHSTLEAPFVPLASVTQAIARIAGARREEDIVQELRATARRLIGSEGIAVIRRDGDLCHYVEEDAIGLLWKGQKFPQFACISGWAMIHRKTVVIPDISKDDRIPYELYAGTFVRSMMMAPINISDPVGSLGAYWSRPYAPSAWEIEILEALASAAATAFETVKAINAASADKVDFLASQAVVVPELSLQGDVERVAEMPVVPKILDVALRMTGMGFAAVARVTDDRWIACQVLDHVGFGLNAGGELPVESTLCNDIRGHREAIAFDDAQAEEFYRNHHTPRIYGLRSYISVPIVLADGRFWGTLCAIDPNPAKVKNPEVLGAFKLFAELIAYNLDAGSHLEETQALLASEQELSELREQFVAVLGHDLRNPIAALDAGTSKLMREGWTEKSPAILALMKASLGRMSVLVDNVMDLARTRLGEGLHISQSEDDVRATFLQVVDELRFSNPARDIVVDFDLPASLRGDHPRLAQMLSNLVGNAITHGAPDKPIRITGYLHDDLLKVCVVNGGETIPAEQMAKLFMPFQRGRNGAGNQGLGLGLFIASEIARAHGGRIEVKSDDHETCFTFAMPIALVN